MITPATALLMYTDLLEQFDATVRKHIWSASIALAAIPDRQAWAKGLWPVRGLARFVCPDVTSAEFQVFQTLQEQKIFSLHAYQHEKSKVVGCILASPVSDIFLPALFGRSDLVDPDLPVHLPGNYGWSRYWTHYTAQEGEKRKARWEGECCYLCKKELKAPPERTFLEYLFLCYPCQEKAIRHTFLADDMARGTIQHFYAHGQAVLTGAR